jgi:hypothetical protein
MLIQGIGLIMFMVGFCFKKGERKSWNYLSGYFSALSSGLPSGLSLGLHGCG